MSSGEEGIAEAATRMASVFGKEIVLSAAM